jgi:hypothetical protein
MPRKVTLGAATLTTLTCWMGSATTQPAIQTVATIVMVVMVITTAWLLMRDAAAQIRWSRAARRVFAANRSSAAGKD